AVNRRWLTDYGFEGQDLIGRCHYDAIPAVLESCRPLHQRVLAGEELTSDGERFRHPDGSVFWVRWAMSPVAHRRGRDRRIATLPNVRS
ncbi:MAG: PAS domain-containing protein, partial [Coleofasciculaceae cyanobacterium SM2_3_26]|nr:PAS domain-containing protein [Coleofasciculaceae cyanobacterium SM2_3_26]